MMRYGPLPVYVLTANFVTLKWTVMHEVNAPEGPMKLFSQFMRNKQALQLFLYCDSGASQLF